MITGNSKDRQWQKLSWAEKVQICNQSIANEDSLLLPLVILFIAFEAILFTVLIGVGWKQGWSIILAVFGIGFAILYTYLFVIRGEWVDEWGIMLYELWQEAGKKELAKNYKGCYERRNKRKEKCGRWKVVFGWCEKDENMGRFKRIISWFKCFHSTKRLFTTFIPLALVAVWIGLMVMSFDC